MATMARWLPCLMLPIAKAIQPPHTSRYLTWMCSSATTASSMARVAMSCVVPSRA